MEKVLDAAAITVNKNAVPGDLKPFIPGGIRIGTPAMTTRGMTEEDVTTVVQFIHRGVNITLDIQKSVEGPKLADFVAKLKGNTEIAALRKEVIDWATKFYMPG